VEIYSKYVNYSFMCFIHLDASNCRYKYKYLLQASNTISNTLHEPYHIFLCISLNIYYMENISNRIYRSLAFWRSAGTLYSAPCSLYEEPIYFIETIFFVRQGLYWMNTKLNEIRLSNLSVTTNIKFH
jgi:hypothetical protein